MVIPSPSRKHQSPRFTCSTSRGQMRKVIVVPEGWNSVRLGDVASVVRGVSWSRDQISKPDAEGAVPVIRISNVQRHGFVSEVHKSRHAITPRTLVMVGSNGNRDRVGNLYMANVQVDGHLLASFLIGIRPTNAVLVKFLAFLLRSGPIQSVLTESTAGSTGLKNLSLWFLRNLSLSLPPFAEQRAIAAVLDSIDEAIERTEALIAATENLRESLRHELLIRGIPGWHSEYKEVPRFGSIPADWEVVRLGNVAEVVGGTTPSRSNAVYWSGDIPWVVPSDLTDLSGRYLTKTREFVTEVGLRSTSLRLVPSGSILLTTRATIGATAINAVPVVTNQGFQNIVGKNGICGLWLFYCVSAMDRELERRAAGSTFQEVSRAGIRSIPILLPPLLEQQAIARVLDSVDNTVEHLKREFDARAELKKSVAEALLTGRVRVGEGISA